MAETVIIKNGLYRVEARRMKGILTQEISEDEVERIAHNREEWLNWMNSHFAYKTLLSPEKYK